jgi:teichoic acid transport system ATP-binding protein
VADVNTDAQRTEAAETAPQADDRTTVLLRGVHVDYRVYEDRRPRFREVLTNGMKRPSFREIHAVRGVDLLAQEGEAIGIIGHNGSGKSTLLQAIAGLLPPTKGEVYARSQPSLLGVSAALRPGVSGRRNIILGGLALGIPRDEIEARMPELIGFTGLEEFIDLPIRTYSSGMRARLHFAIATSIEPEILLIDEALSVGDEDFKKRSQKRIEELRERAGSVFLVSHSLSTIKDSCTRCLWLHKGKVRYDAEPAEVIKRYRKHMKASTEGPGAAR